MLERHFPVRPNLDQLRHQAKDLLRAIRQGDPAAIADLKEHHPEPLDPTEARLADVQLALAHSYGIPSWPRLVTACRMSEAIWQDDIGTIRQMVLSNPRLLHEQTNGQSHSNWGPPMSYAANLGKIEIVEALRDLGAVDLQHAFGRACLQSKLDTAHRLHAMGAKLEAGAVMGPCETLSGSGLEFVLELGAEFADETGDRLAPIGLILETYGRNPVGKHRCIELAIEQGIEIPDTPAMALHRGRIDLLEKHWRRDLHVFSRTFSHEEIFPQSLGCHADESLALHGTPVAGTTLLHLCVDYDEIEIAEWLLKNGADANVKAAVDAEGFGGHTPLFNCVVSQAYRCNRQRDGAFVRLLFDYGADPNVRASLRKRLRFVEDEGMYEYPDVTPLEWGQRFHGQEWVSKVAMQLIMERGGEGL